jgi:FemAB-related protein (PEP-CTERM system-associated)
MIRRTFGHEIFYLVARERGLICGVLPLTKVNSRLFGNRMISQAFSNYGGPLADDAGVLGELLNRAFELACQHGSSQVEFRNLELLPYDLVSKEDKVCMFLPLASDPDEMWRRLKPEIRNRVRKAKKSGFVAASGGRELLGEFYQIWTIRMRQLGTPCYPESLFRGILETFPRHSRIFVVRLGHTAVGAAFDYSFNGLAQCRWAATRVEFNRLAPNTLLYWSAISHYCLAGDRTFDFGRSTVDSSQYEFKRRWGTLPVQLYYQYWTAPGHELSQVRPDSPKYATGVERWKKLPLSITRVVGPHISRNLP